MASLSDALNASVLGMKSNSNAIAVYSGNISNSNSIGYKKGDVSFSSFMNQSGGVGVSSKAHYDITSQGASESTASQSSIMIDGQGMFATNTKADKSGETLYTRAGDFEIDPKGNWRNGSGLFLMAKPIVDSTSTQGGVIIDDLKVVNLSSLESNTSPTKKMSIGVNLNANQDSLSSASTYTATGATNIASSAIDPHFKQYIKIFDSLGSSHNATIGYIKTDQNKWKFELFANNKDEITTTRTDGLIAHGALEFNGDGALKDATLTPILGGSGTKTKGTDGRYSYGDIEVPWKNKAETSKIKFDFGIPGAVKGTVGASEFGSADGIRQFGSPYGEYFVNQDGAPIGSMQSTEIDDSGFIVANFNNGTSKKAFRLALADFPNPNGLKNNGGNAYTGTQSSGKASLNYTESNGVGSVKQFYVEGSNVQIANEFSNIIVKQQAYKANARVMKTTGDLFEELIRVLG